MTGVTPYTGQDAYGENGTVARRGDGDRFAVVVGGEHLMGYGMLSVQLPDDILGVEIVEEYRRVAGDEGIAPRSIRRPRREADALR